MKRILRTNSSVDFHHAIVRASHNAIESAPDPFGNCLNCMYFNEKDELCKLCNQRPPARIIAYGCKEWEDMEIPF